MSSFPGARMAEEDLKSFLYDRIRNDPAFQPVIDVSVQKYPAEYTVTILIGQTPTPEVRQRAYELEAELRNLGLTSSIIVKSDQEPAFGEIRTLQTNKGKFSYRLLKLEPIKDEDLVYLFGLSRGPKSYRIRVSLSRTLASILKNNDKFDEQRVLEVYADAVRSSIERGEISEETTKEIMFDSSQRTRFGLR